MQYRWPQEGFQAAFRALFPEGLVDFELPVLEDRDLSVQEPFHLFAQYLEIHGQAVWEPQAPVVTTASRKGISRSGPGSRQGTTSADEFPLRRSTWGCGKRTT